MAIQINELIASRVMKTGQRGSVVTEWIIFETDPLIPLDEETASAELDTATPTYWGTTGFRKNETSVEPVGDPLLSRMWKGVVDYLSPSGGSSTPAESGESFFSFDTGSATVHITQSRDTYDKLGFDDGGTTRTATDWNKMINASKDEVKGVDIISPEFRFSETHYFDSSFVDTTYKQVLKAMGTTQNNAPFRGYNAGEVLFINAVGSRRGTNSSDGWEITYNFSVKDTITAGTVFAPNITPLTTDRAGWSYVWVGYTPEDDSTSGTPRQKLVPKEAYVEEIYKPTDFANLGIGVSP